MPCSCVVCLLCCVLLLDSSYFVAIVRIRSSTLGSGFIRSSSSWTRSSSLRDFRQDDRYPGSHYYHCYASCFVLSLCRASYHLFLKPPKLPCQPLTFSPFLANRCLAMLPLCPAPFIALLVAGAVAVCSMSGHGYHGYFGISQYLLFN